jgi:hypothetical protein
VEHRDPAYGAMTLAGCVGVETMPEPRGNGGPAAHPLDPLTAGEIDAAVAILKTAGVPPALILGVGTDGVRRRQVDAERLRVIGVRVVRRDIATTGGMAEATRAREPARIRPRGSRTGFDRG